MSDTPQIDTEQFSATSSDSTLNTSINEENGRLDALMPSKRQLAVLIAVAVGLAVLAWWVRQQGDSNSGNVGPAEQELLDSINHPDDEAAEADDEGEKIEVPAAPSDELEKDQAVLEGLKKSGKMAGNGE